MSYCVNCGVRLEASLTECPLCHTPVINPNEIPYTQSTSPFPQKKGQVDAVKRKDWAILLSIVLTAASLACGLLNGLVYRQSLWSFPIIGACIIIWVFAIPFIIHTKLPMPVTLLFDGLAVSLYLYLLTFMTGSAGWLYALGLPITAVVTVLLILFFLLRHKVSSSFLPTALYLFAEIPVLCIGIELLVRRFLAQPARITWSAVVLTACAIIVAALATILSKIRFRNAVRRRLHF